MTSVTRINRTVRVTRQEPQVTVGRATAADVERARTITNEIERTRTVTVEAAGPQGPQGAPGDGTFQMIANGTISALRIVVSDGDGTVRYPDLSDNADADRVVGISFTAATDGNTLTVQSDGPITENLWTWLPGTIWCGANGVLTQTVPAAPAWLLEVGRVLSPTKITLDIQTPIIRA